MCNKAVSCSMFRNVPMSTKKNGKIKEKKPETAPWLRTPEPPRTERKRKERKEKHHGPKKKPAPKNAQEKSPRKNPRPKPAQSLPTPTRPQRPRSETEPLIPWPPDPLSCVLNVLRVLLLRLWDGSRTHPPKELGQVWPAVTKEVVPAPA